MRLLVAFAVAVGLSGAQEPNLHAWIMSQTAHATAPDVHAVENDDCFVYVKSAGLSLHSFGALEANQYEPPSGVRALTFRIPRHPHKAAAHQHTPLGIIGVFSTGVPIYNAIGTSSYNDQNLWHQDAVKASAIAATPLLTAVTRDTRKHSPIIGFALDGFPIYGPFAYGPGGSVKRMRSSYHLRTVSRRDTLPGGPRLTPSQEGPRVNAEFPLGTFSEDYEYREGSGDLDAFNGAFVRTPEYPDGTYAYFLATTDTGAPAWPYLVGTRYYGDAQLPAVPRKTVQHAHGVDLSTDRADIRTGEPVNLSLAFHDRQGRSIQFLEKVHQQPVHVVVVSKDLAHFDHIHPQPGPDDALIVSHTFRCAGDYWIYADYTAPGQPPAIARFQLSVAGARQAETPAPPTSDVKIDFAAPSHIATGTDVSLSFHLTNRLNGQPIADLEPWLGAWAHIMIVSADGSNFIHAHPLDNAASAEPTQPHRHGAIASGPSPEIIRTATGFNTPGTYKVWLQFQRKGVVVTESWLLKVSSTAARLRQVSVLAPGTIQIKVSSAGFTPSRIELPAGKESHLAFTRNDAQNCAHEVVLPDFGIRKALPVGETVTIDFPPHAAGELHFACGMGMHKGALVLR